VIANLVINGFPEAGIEISYPQDATPSNNRVLHNYIGVNATGTQAVPNGFGAEIHGFASDTAQALANVIDGNVISGNKQHGVALCDAKQTQVTNNIIGADRLGVAPIGNGSHGIWLLCAGDPANRIENNVIAFNGGSGILDTPDYNYAVATTAGGHQGNAFRHNAIYSNKELGINLLPPPAGYVDGVTPNDPGDGDNGANLLQNYPVLTAVKTTGATTTISGTLNSQPNQTFAVELFLNDAADPSGYGEGQIYLTTVTVNTDGAGNASFTVTLPRGMNPGQFVTATATDSAGNTSEFSAALGLSTANQPPVCTNARPSIATLWPPDHKFVPVTVLGVTDPNRDATKLTITSIFQDEPVTSRKDDDTAPDGKGVGASVAKVRAERSGSGNGRVYHIGFTAQDGHGGVCSGNVLVGVPKNKGKKGDPVDDGPRYDSTLGKVHASDTGQEDESDLAETTTIFLPMISR
jgi:parallel beta-helix repeat protein